MKYRSIQDIKNELKRKFGPPREKRKKDPVLAEILLHGRIQSRANTTLWTKTNFITPPYVRDFVELALKRGARGILFNIDSGGGSACASYEINRYISEIKVPTLALVTASALSGGYVVACGCDHIMAYNEASIGSIGVISFNYRYYAPEYQEKYMRNQKIQAGDFKQSFDGFNPLSEEVLEHYQRNVDKIYEIFKQIVAEQREIDPKKVDSLANGLSYLACMDGLELGLIDEIGRRRDAHKKLNEFCGLEKSVLEEFSPNTYKKRSSKSF